MTVMLQSRQYHYREAARLLEETAMALRKAAHEADKENLHLANQHADTASLLFKKGSLHLEEAPRHKYLPPMREPGEGMTWAKFLIPGLLLLVALLVAVLVGSTGDLTKTWDEKNIQNSVRYPKSPS